MKIILSCYHNPSLGDAWRKLFVGEPVEITERSLLDLECDAIVSPANSFGIMDGGLDWDIRERFGHQIEERLQRQIAKNSLRELLVGEALAIHTNDERIRWLIAAPTMRVPMSHGIAESVNAYLAMKAALMTAWSYQCQIHTVAIPGLCTGVGRMKPETAALQMFTAYREVVLGQRPRVDSCVHVQANHLMLNPLARIH
jgi:O-acetyl-ADP-ribose deacetylase (regulator of RNase III)